MAIQIRRGTNANWESNNSNIVAGEPAIATDTGRFFVGTGNGTFVEFANKAETALLKTGTEITATSSTHADLNDYRTTGTYYVKTSTIAGYIDNSPIATAAYRLFVVNLGVTSTTRIKQFIIPNLSSGNIYYRYYNGSWTDWDRISGNKQLPFQNIEWWGAKSDGTTDCTTAIRAALSACESVYIPRGTYLVSETIVVPYGRRIFGCGRSSKLQLAPTFNLTAYPWRTGRDKYPIFVIQNNCVLENFLLNGDETTPFDGGMVGIYVSGDHISLKNVSTQNINYFPNDWIGGESGYGTENAPAWALGILHSNDVSVEGGSFDGNGYEGIGTEACNDVRISNVFIGAGNRTGLQIHRGTNKLVVSNCVIDNTCVNANANITAHSSQDSPITNILINNCQVGVTSPRDQAILFPQIYVDNFMVTNCLLKATKNITYMDAQPSNTSGRFSFVGNMAFSDTNGFRLRGGTNLFVGNFIDAQYKAIETGSTTQEASGNLFINANVVS